MRRRRRTTGRHRRHEAVNRHRYQQQHRHDDADHGDESSGGPITPDCGSGQTCEVVGGSAVGGVAFTCDEAGNVTEGNSYEKVNCVEGLMCIENTCCEMCDPTNDMCATSARI